MNTVWFTAPSAAIGSLANALSGERGSLCRTAPTGARRRALRAVGPRGCKPSRYQTSMRLDSGSIIRIVVPLPGAVDSVKVPPSDSTRKRMPTRP